MRTGLKVILIFVAIMIGGAIIAISKEATGRGGSSGGGPLGIIITFALLAGVRAIWKYNPDATENGSEIQKKDDDKHTLDKS
jgi:hypothetical protein